MHDLRTERLTLTPVDPAEVDELHALFTDTDVRRWLLDDGIVTREWVEEEVAASADRFAAGGCGLWSVREVGGGDAIVGFVGYRPFFEPAELLYGFLPAFWGRGFATEAAAEALRHAFETLGREDVRAATDVPNIASMRVLERLGLQEWKRTDDGPAGTIHFRLRRHEWARPSVERLPRR